MPKMWAHDYENMYITVDVFMAVLTSQENTTEFQCGP